MPHLLGLSALALAVLSFPWARRLRWPLALGFAVMFVAQSASVYVTGEPFGPVAFAHLTGETTGMVLRHGSGLAPLVLAALTAGLAVFAGSRWARGLDARPRWRWGVLAGATILLALPGGVLANGYRVAREWWVVRTMDSPARPLTLTDALAPFGIARADFVENRAARGWSIRPDRPGRNVVVLHLESFSRAFLDRPELTPALNRLARRWTRLDDFDHDACDAYTLAALYISHTGMPHQFGGTANTFFLENFHPRLPALGSIFGTAGYERLSLMTAPGFAGMGDFLARYGFASRGGPEDFDEAALDHWGVRDQELYRLAREEYTRLSAAGKPFFLWILTTDTHFPDIRTDAETFAGAPPELSDTEKAVWAADRRAAEFVEFVESRDNADETVVFIMPDHRDRNALPWSGEADPGLFVLTNAPRERLGAAATRRISHLDLPRLILNGAELDTNVRFFNELLTPPPPPAERLGAYLGLRHHDIIRLNRVLWRQSATTSVSMTVEREGAARRFILTAAGGRRTVELPPERAAYFFIDEFHEQGDDAPVHFHDDAGVMDAITLIGRLVVVLRVDGEDRLVLYGGDGGPGGATAIADKNPFRFDYTYVF